MTSKWFLKNFEGIKIFFRINENSIGIRSTQQSDDAAEILSVVNARKRWKELLSQGHLIINRNQMTAREIREIGEEWKESSPEPPNTYWGENVGHHAGIGIPLEVPESTYRENDSNSSSYDQDDYETQQGY